MKDNKMVVVEKEGILKKIKKFFSKIFNSSNNNMNSEAQIIEKENINSEKDNFVNSLKVDRDNIKELKIKFENGSITEEELTDYEKEQLNKIYDDEIKAINERITHKKKKIQQLRKDSKNKNPNYSRKLWQIKKVG